MEHILNCAAPLCLHVQYDFSSSFPADCETVSERSSKDLAVKFCRYDAVLLSAHRV